ncbi:XF1762 family protein [Arenibacter sp. F20364]|uniref:XF1762 family protein n=1 Tax=Arenibacter sp. F20364 TaxID=2926415 RepID=UPI001FF295CE|nr:XF1762 family protein [Arenibacter sp. F20364]MCK0190849.1 hypothetical protein [Arenibacter sp. F20364]
MAKNFITKPTTIAKANEFVKENHRHHRPTARNGGKWALSAIDKESEEIIGVLIAGNPVSATYMDGKTLEVTRLCIKENAPMGAASFLLSKCSKIWKIMGGDRIITYTLQKECGASLKGAGWDKVAELMPHNDWKYKSDKDGKKRDKLEIYQLKKFRWENII